jgi:thioredoxin-dependent peroxiredoxin
VGVSPDAQERSDAFRASLSLPYPLVGDPAVVRAWGVRWPIFGRARRVSFVVGRDRRVVHRYVNEMDALAHVSEALRVL